MVSTQALLLDLNLHCLVPMHTFESGFVFDLSLTCVGSGEKAILAGKHERNACHLFCAGSSLSSCFMYVVYIV